MIDKNSLPVALVVEPHPFFASFLRAMLARSGHAVVASSASASKLLLQRLAPGTIVFGPGACGHRPLDAIRRARSARPEAFIVAIGESDDSVWKALARALGADVILGPGAGTNDLLAALAPPGKRQENGASFGRRDGMLPIGVGAMFSHCRDGN